MRVLQIGSDRSKGGILYSGTPAFKRQEAYAQQFGNLDIIGFSLKGEAQSVETDPLHVFPTDSASKLLWGFDAVRIAGALPRPDVVSVQDPFETGLVGWWIARKLGVPLHVQVHTDFLSPEYARLSFMNRIRVLVAGFVLRRAARARVVSGRVGSSIQKKYNTKTPITVLPIFVDVEKFKRALSNSKATAKTYSYTALIVSRSGSEKNLGLAIKAFERVAPNDARLIVCGDVREQDVLDEQSGRIYFVNYQKDLAPIYKSVDIVLVPSLYEGYGLVIIESLAAGKPVLSTDVGIAREAGAIVTTEEKFADALAEWFKNGPRTGELKNYPYKSFDEYVRAYCDDIASCVKA